MPCPRTVKPAFQGQHFGGERRLRQEKQIAHAALAKPFLLLLKFVFLLDATGPAAAVHDWSCTRLLARRTGECDFLLLTAWVAVYTDVGRREQPRIGDSMKQSIIYKDPDMRLTVQPLASIFVQCK